MLAHAHSAHDMASKQKGILRIFEYFLYWAINKQLSISLEQALRQSALPGFEPFSQ
jgi:hypothetical protein